MTGATSLRFEIFPSDLDATVEFYARVLRFTLLRDQRRTAEPYVFLRVTSRSADGTGAHHGMATNGDA